METIPISILRLFDKLPKEVVVNILLSSLDEMRQFNGQTNTSAICKTLGAEQVSNKKPYKWNLPPMDKIKRDFNY